MNRLRIYFEGRVDRDNVVDNNDEEKRFKGKHDKAEPQINILQIPQNK